MHVLFDLLIFGLGVLQPQRVIGSHQVLAVQTRLLRRVILVILLLMLCLKFEGHEIAEVVGYFAEVGEGAQNGARSLLQQR